MIPINLIVNLLANFQRITINHLKICRNNRKYQNIQKKLLFVLIRDRNRWAKYFELPEKNIFFYEIDFAGKDITSVDEKIKFYQSAVSSYHKQICEAERIIKNKEIALNNEFGVNINKYLGYKEHILQLMQTEYIMQDILEKVNLQVDEYNKNNTRNSKDLRFDSEYKDLCEICKNIEISASRDTIDVFKNACDAIIKWNEGENNLSEIEELQKRLEEPFKTIRMVIDPLEKGGQECHKKISKKISREKEIIQSKLEELLKLKDNHITAQLNYSSVQKTLTSLFQEDLQKTKKEFIEHLENKKTKRKNTRSTRVSK